MELRRRLGFAFEPGHRARAQAHALGEDFQSHPPVQRQLARLVDHPHPPAAELAEDLKVAQTSGGRGRIHRTSPIAEAFLAAPPTTPPQHYASDSGKVQV